MTATTETTAAPAVRVFKPSDGLLALVADIKTVAKFDPGIIQVFEQATKINAVNMLMSNPEMEAILDKLEGSPAGFQTDKKNGEKYEKKVRNAAVTAALSQGARLVNKEFAIIRDNAFLGKNYYQRMLSELGHDGAFTESCKYRMLWWDTIIGEIKTNGAIATAEVVIDYKLVDKGTGLELTKQFKRLFQLKTYSTDTPDLWVGKFERRAWQALLRYLSGVDFGEDGDDTAPAPATPPPVGVHSLKTEATPPAAKAEDATFREVVTARPEPVAAPAEATSKPQKAYAEMSPEEKRAATAASHAQSAQAVAVGGKPELF